jgi:hypothetical protein
MCIHSPGGLGLADSGPCDSLQAPASPARFMLGELDPASAPTAPWADLRTIIEIDHFGRLFSVLVHGVLGHIGSHFASAFASSALSNLPLNSFRYHRQYDCQHFSHGNLMMHQSPDRIVLVLVFFQIIGRASIPRRIHRRYRHPRANGQTRAHRGIPGPLSVCGLR